MGIGDPHPTEGLRNLYLEQLKALLAQDRGLVDEMKSGRTDRDVLARLCGDARSLRGDAAEFGLPRVSEIGSAVEALLVEFLSAPGRKDADERSVVDALDSALRAIGDEVTRAEGRPAGSA